MLPVPVTTVNNPNNVVILNHHRSSFTQVLTVRRQLRTPSHGFYLHTSFTKQLITKLELTERVLQRRALQNTDYAATGGTLCRSSKEIRWSGGHVKKTYFSSGVNGVVSPSVSALRHSDPVPPGPVRHRLGNLQLF